MITVTRDQAFQRWDTLPSVLCDAIFSDANLDFLYKICEAEHIPEEKVDDIVALTNYVLMGFLHPEDLKDEINALTSLDAKIAGSIADAINKRIFAPLRGDIDKVYRPAGAADVTAPKVMQDIATGPITLEGLSKGSSAPVSLSGGIPTPPTSPAAQAALSDRGWSKIAPGDPVLRFDASRIAPPPTPPKAPSVPPPVAPSKSTSAGTMGEFERMGLNKTSAPSPAAVPATSATPKPATPASSAAEAAPVMLHEDASFKSIQQSSDFHLSRPNEGAEINISAVKPPSASTKPAVLEFTGASQAPKPPTAPSKMVHYTDLAPVTPGLPPSAAPGRSVSEITTPPPASSTPPTPPKPMSATPSVSPMPQAPAPMPKPSVPPPMPPAPTPAPATPPPKPPQTPPSGEQKVIKKDYL